MDLNIKFQALVGVKLAISRILFLSFHLQVVPGVRAMDFGYVVTGVLLGPRSKDVRRSGCQILA